MAAPQYTRSLVSAQRRGARIAVTGLPWRGFEVVYEPRGGNDPKPWALVVNKLARFSGKDCHAERFTVEQVTPTVLRVRDLETGEALPSRVFSVPSRARDCAHKLNYPEV